MRPREFDNDALLRIAFDQVWRKGLRGALLSDIAREAGVQRGSLYNAFGSKEALFLAAYDRYAGDYLAAVEQTLGGGNLRDSLTAFFEMTIRNFRSGTPPRGCPTTRGLMELDSSADAALHHQARDAFAALVTRITALIEAAFVRAAARGEFSGDAAAAAWQIATVTRGLAVLERAFDDEPQLRNIAAHTIDLVLGKAGRAA
ncbi:TetR/AcrR family transcriptional regulator [Ferrovibrio terrae]|uniref:TetR/AcrR family transcriptional regulator n=1 Tax=Ferrovibrio terrae TaxID=2594003 RepID=A0A516GZD2_9PROT|nr:TetR/AcrR family transcriptional regulator [Ferrovibrio terrae]QDO96855.1 TetR/AcrR family transcriptional regulator [Ferrovibrio terrae]